MTTRSFQCYIIKFSSTSTLLKSNFGSNISLGMANLNMINISSINFYIWQHLEKHQNESHLQHLASIHSVPFGLLYRHMAKGIPHFTPFSPEKSTGDTNSIWTLFSHTGIYVMAIGLLIPMGLEIIC